MSEPKLISPMLDNFAMGEPISDRNGVRCCPAIAEDTEDKYIVKIISLPASQNQLEALILSGACKDKTDALSYFDALANGVIDEVQTLKKLSQLEGFIAYENCQIVPMDDESGYDVYLLSSYKNTLEQHFRHKPMTHLGALNLGLDLCSALSVCRRSGYLYVDLKPDNIYITGEHTYRIGDIGFVKLDSLKYASLPDRYRSQYTAPEIQDAYSALNATVDVYALGLILYQAFNGGVLPFREDDAPDESFPPPAYADYEMAEIILKACYYDPADRWQDPVEMGQALVNYMQRNGAHDTPIIPVTVPDTEIADNSTETEDTEASGVDAQIDMQEQDQPNSEDETTEIDSTCIYEEDDDGNLTFLSTDSFDDADLEAEAEQIDYEEVTDEVSEILVQADALIAHPAPEPVIPPEPIDVPIPEPLPLEDEQTETEEIADDDAETESVVEDESNEEPDQLDVNTEETCEEQPVKRSHWLRNTFLVIMAIAVLAVGFLYYKNFYLQPIDSIILDDSVNGSLTVYVNSKIDETKLTVICSDTYGNQLTAPVENGEAKFINLAPNSAFTVKVAIDGFHKLTGDTFAAFTTPAQTEIVQFHAVTGAEDGSAILGFTINGPDSDEWIVRYSTSDEEEKEVIFSGHMLTLNGLTIGKQYDFLLQPVDELLITGIERIQHTASRIVKAEEFIITGCANGKLTASWAAPKDIQVASWTVRCYNENGYDETTVVTNTNVAFENIDMTSGYTVEVTATGMSVGQRVFVDANSVTAGLTITDTDPNKIVLSWNSDANAPQGGWLLQYSINGSGSQEITCEENNTATLSNEIPGVLYTFTLQAADGTPLLGNVVNYETPAPKKFKGYGVSADDMEFSMCKTPKVKNWDRYDLRKSDYTTTFESGTKASFLVRMRQQYSTSPDNITTLFVVRNKDGMIVNTSSVSKTWTSMWYKNYCELDIPAIPETAGKYSVSVYFNGMLVNEQAFKVID